MNKNVQNPRIVFFDRTEKTIQAGKQYLVVHDKDGAQHKISEKRQSLWSLFDNAFDFEAYLFIYETYNNIEYVADVQKVVDALMQRAVRDIGVKLADKATEERNRSTALSYSKDLVVAGIIPIEGLFNAATRNWEFIKGVQHDSTGERDAA